MTPTPDPLREAARSLVDALEYVPGSLLGGKIALVRAALSAQPTPPPHDDLGAAWAEAEAALPESGWLTVDSVGPGLVTVEAAEWPDGSPSRSIARAFKLPILDAVRKVAADLAALQPSDRVP